MTTTYSVIERRSGNVVASFRTEGNARRFVATERESADEWALVAFGPQPTQNRLVKTWPGNPTTNPDAEDDPDTIDEPVTEENQ